MAKKQCRTQDLIGLNRFGENGIVSENGGEVVWFLVQASNLSVLSPEHIGEKIANLTGLLSVLPECEILCVDAQESFDANLRFLEKRIAERTRIGRTAVHIFIDKILYDNPAKTFTLISHIVFDSQAIGQALRF